MDYREATIEVIFFAYLADRSISFNINIDDAYYLSLKVLNYCLNLLIVLAGLRIFLK